VPRLLYEEVVGYTPAVAGLLTKHCGATLPRDYFRMDLTRVAPRPTRWPRDRFVPWLGPGADQALRNDEVDEWGVWRRVEGVHQLVRIHSPLRHLTERKALEDYPWPDLDEGYRFEGVARQIDSLHGQGWAVVGYAGSVFERAWYLRGFEEMLMDLVANRTLADAMLERTAWYQRCLALQFARAGADVVLVGDDIAGQQGLLMSLSTWRTHLKPHLAALVAELKTAQPKIGVCYHSDGNVEPAVGDLVEIGVDILNPVQPECVDVAALHRRFGRHIAFWGTVSVQHTLPFGTPDQVRAEVRARLALMGTGGGFILCPAHRLGAEVPWENIRAFFEAADEWPTP